MSTCRKISVAVLTAVMAMLCTFALVNVSAETKTRENLFTAESAVTIAATDTGMEFTTSASWGNSVIIETVFDLDNFEVEFDDTMTNFVDVRFFDATTFAEKFFIRLNTRTPEQTIVVDLFRADNTHMTRIVPTGELFRNGLCNFSCRDGMLFLNGTDVSSFTGSMALKSYLSSAFEINLTDDLALVHLRYQDANVSTMTRLNGTSLAKDASDTSKPFFRMNAPEEVFAVGAKATFDYRVFDLVDTAPTVMLEYRLGDGESQTVHSDAFVPTAAGNYTATLIATDAAGNEGRSAEFTFEVSSVEPPVIEAVVPATCSVGDSVTVPDATVTGAEGLELETTVKVLDVYGDETALADGAFVAERYSKTYQVVYESCYKTLPDTKSKKSYPIEVQGADEKLALPSLFTPINGANAPMDSPITATKDGLLLEVTTDWSGPRYDRAVNFQNFSIRLKNVETVTSAFLFPMSQQGDYAGASHQILLDFVNHTFAVRTSLGVVLGESRPMGEPDAEGFYTFSIQDYNKFSINGTTIVADAGLDKLPQNWFGFRCNIDTAAGGSGKLLVESIDGQSFARPYASVPAIKDVSGISESVIVGTTADVTYSASDFFGKTLTGSLSVTVPGGDKTTVAAVDGTVSYTFDQVGVYVIKLTVANEFGSVGETQEYRVTVTEPVETGIEIVSGPTKLVYKTGESFSADGLSVKLLFEGGAEKILEAKEYAVTGFDSASAGTKTLTVTYKTFEKTFTVTVEDPILEKIEITVKPSKTVYVLGSDLNLDGMVVKAKYDTGDSVTLKGEDYTVAGFDKNLLGEQTVTVSFGGKNASFKVTVKNEKTGIEITGNPTKLTYQIGEELDLSGLKLSAVFEDGSKVELAAEEFTVSGFDKNKAGEQTVTVTAFGFTATFTVSIEEKTGCGTFSSGDGIMGMLVLAGLAFLLFATVKMKQKRAD